VKASDNRVLRPLTRCSFVLAVTAAAFACGSAVAQGTPVPNPYNQTRASSFTHYGAADGAKKGLLKSETIEPGNAQLCVTTTYDYDAYGNKTIGTTANCAGATGRAVFTSRSSTSTFAAQTLTVAGVTGVVTPAGTYATSAANALTQSETRTYDPRFGAPLSLTGPNTLTTSWTLDNFGRTTMETRADGTRTLTAYCFVAAKVSDTTSNSATANGDPLGCPSPAAAEIPNDAVSFVHTEPHDNSAGVGAKNGPFARVYTDRAGRKIRSVTEAFDGPSQPSGPGSLIVQDTDYNAQGVAVVATQPYFLTTKSSTTTGANDYGMTRTDYDVLGRAVAIYSADPQGLAGSQSFGGRGSRVAAKVTTAYAGLVTTVTNDKNQIRREEKDIEGKVVRVTDALGAQLAHQYDAFGSLVATKDALQNIVTLAYDLRGRKVSMTDPDAGLWQYDYNALGELVWQQNAKQRATTPTPTVTTMAYDKLGRLTSRVEPEYTSTWSYDTYIGGAACNKGIGKLCETSNTNNIGRKFVYDNLGRPINTRVTVTSGPSFASAVAYNATHGRVASMTYPTGVKVNYSYTAKGFLSTLKLSQAATVAPLPATPGGTPGPTASLPAGSTLWSAAAYNAWGKAEQHSFGNGVNNRATFDAMTGRVTANTAGAGTATGVANYSYVWDSINQLTQRNDANGDGASGAVSDTFTYDALGRLRAYTVAAPSVPNLARTVNLQYNALGMLLYKSDVGVYGYGAQATAGVKPHALLSVSGASTTNYTYDANGNLVTASAGKYRSISFTSFNLPDSQTGLQGPSGSPKYTWAYDENHQRVKETRVVGGVTRTTWSVHPDNQGGLGFECESSGSNVNCSNATTQRRHYVSAGGTAVGVLVSTGALPALTSTQTAPPVVSTTIALVKVEYWHKDHLGSLVATTDHAGAVTARYSYDPFGKRRQAGGQYDAMGSLVIDWTTNTNNGTDRGYTGHEHLDDAGLVHMNGRIFDPTLGRFMQSDPLVQDPLNLQNFDRYGYCFNNPLTCTDPSGYSFWTRLRKIGLILGGDPRAIHNLNRKIAHTKWGYTIGSIAIGAVSAVFCNVYAAACNGVGQAAWAGFAGQSFSDSLRTGLIAGATTQAFGAVGDATTSYTDAYSEAYRTPGQVAGNIAGHAAVGCASAAASGGGCRGGALSAAFGAAYSNSLGYSRVFALATMQHAFVGGVGSVLGGGKFADGAITGAMGYLFNECAHTRMCGSDSTRIVISGNPVGGSWSPWAHAEIQISSGYDFVVLEAQAGLHLTGASTSFFTEGGGGGAGANAGAAFTLSITAPEGDSLGAIASRMMEGAAKYDNGKLYGIPSIYYAPNQMAFGSYNSNSYVGGVLDYALPVSGPRWRWAAQQAALSNGFLLPGMQNPVKLGP